MGKGIGVKCKGCNHEGYLNFGVGFRYPLACIEAKQAALNGKLGEEWKKIVSETPNSVVETRSYLFWCPECHCFEMGSDLSIYKPKINQEPAKRLRRTKDPIEEWDSMHSEICHENYELVKEFIHECPKCKTKMERKNEYQIKNLELICFHCGGKVELTNDILMWD